MPSGRAGARRRRRRLAAADGSADRRQLPAPAALDRRAALRRPDRGRRRLVVLRRAGRGHHRRAVVPARADRDQPRLGAALSRPGARAAARAARARRALHADRQRAPLRRQGAPVGRALRLRERHGDLDRPLRLRRRRSFRAAGRAFGTGGGDDRAAGPGERAPARDPQAPREPRRLRMRAARARPALPRRGRSVAPGAAAVRARDRARSALCRGLCAGRDLPRRALLRGHLGRSRGPTTWRPSG